MAKRKKKREKHGYLIFIPFVVLAVFLFFLNINLWNQRKITQEQLEIVEKRLEDVSDRKYLEGQLKERDLEDEIERIAREQLLLRKEGESVIVISREDPEDDVSGEEEEEKKSEEGGFWKELKRAFSGE